MMSATTWMSFKNIMLDKRRQIQKITYSMITFIWSIQNRSTEKESRWVVAVEGEGIDELLLKKYGVLLWSDGNVWELDRGCGCTSLWMY